METSTAALVVVVPTEKATSVAVPAAAMVEEATPAEAERSPQTEPVAAEEAECPEAWMAA